MGRRNNTVLENVTILDIADKGQAIARVNEMVVFVTGVVQPKRPQGTRMAQRPLTWN